MSAREMTEAQARRVAAQMHGIGAEVTWEQVKASVSVLARASEESRRQRELRGLRCKRSS